MKKLVEYFQGDGLRAQLLKGATGVAGLKALNMVLTLAVGVILARSLGPENYGIYAFVLSVITLMGLPTKAGLPTLVVRETAKYQLKEKWSHLRGLLTLANVFVIGFSILTAALAAVVAWWLWGEAQSEKVSTFLWALFLLPLVAFGNIRGATLRGLRKVVQGQVPEEIVRPLVLILLLGVAFVLEVKITPQSAMQYTVLGALAAFVVGASLLYRAIPPMLRDSWPQYEARAWAGSLIPLSLMSGLLLANGQIGLLFLGTLSSDLEVGFFKVVLSVSALVIAFMQVIDRVLAPHIVRLFHAGERNKLQRVLFISAWVSFLTSLPVVILLALCGENLIMLVFGRDYAVGDLIILIICGGQIANAITGPSSLMLNYIGYERVLLQGVMIFIVMNSFLCLVLIPDCGSLGAAIALAASQLVFNFANSYRLYRLSGYNSTVFSIWGRA